MECHPWFEVSDRRKIRFRNVQIKVLLVFEQGRPLQVSTSFDNFDQFQPVSTSFDQFRPVLTSLDWFISLLITSKIQYFWGGSLLLPTSVLGSTDWQFLKIKEYFFFFFFFAKGKKISEHRLSTNNHAWRCSTDSKVGSALDFFLKNLDSHNF